MFSSSNSYSLLRLENNHYTAWTDYEQIIRYIKRGKKKINGIQALVNKEHKWDQVVKKRACLWSLVSQNHKPKDECISQ
jgi:hypothetical protein